ncbi:MAG: GGDEF domain-containing protein [candidate division Zixibacteria bacterium]
MRKLNPLKDLESVLAGIASSLISCRTEGKIQKVASQLSAIFINHLQAAQILFFRCQKRNMEMNYVYGLKNIRRSRYRIQISDNLLKQLTSGKMLYNISELDGNLNNDLENLLLDKKFNLVFPIFWNENLFGVYFIRTALPYGHPLINLFLLFLNQNLSITYHLTRVESTRRMLESKLKNNKIQDNAKGKYAANASQVNDPGYLIEMFTHRKVDDLMANVFEKVKTGLKADKLLFLSRPYSGAPNNLKYSIGMDRKEFPIDSKEFGKIFGAMQKQQIYDIRKIPKSMDEKILPERISQIGMDYMSTFSLDEKEQGLLFWSGRDEDSQSDFKILNQFERVARRAMNNALEFEKYEEMSYTDSLTRLYNYRYFIKRLGEEIQRAKRFNRRVGLLLFDIDDFKVYNDNFGHQWGDELLRCMGDTLSRSLRSIDIVSRYGGDEFCIIMPEADKITCGIFMDRLRHAINSTDFRDKANGFEGRITISIGAAIFPDDAENADSLIYCSDMALLHSKNYGRNRSTLFSEDLLTAKK